MRRSDGFKTIAKANFQSPSYDPKDNMNELSNYAIRHQ